MEKSSLAPLQTRLKKKALTRLSPALLPAAYFTWTSRNFIFSDAQKGRAGTGCLVNRRALPHRKLALSEDSTNDAFRFVLEKRAKYIMLVPCCQTEVVALLPNGKDEAGARGAIAELWRHAIHTREFGAQITNVLRGLQLEAHGYQVTATELVGWEHSMKKRAPHRAVQKPAARALQPTPQQCAGDVWLTELRERFSGAWPSGCPFISGSVFGPPPIRIRKRYEPAFTGRCDASITSFIRTLQRRKPP